jgi:hypothetical protein
VKGTLIGLQQAEPKQEAISAGDTTLMLGTTDIAGAETWLKSQRVKTEPIVEIPQTVKLMTFLRSRRPSPATPPAVEGVNRPSRTTAAAARSW